MSESGVLDGGKVTGILGRRQVSVLADSGDEYTCEFRTARTFAIGDRVRIVCRLWGAVPLYLAVPEIPGVSWAADVPGPTSEERHEALDRDQEFHESDPFYEDDGGVT